MKCCFVNDEWYFKSEVYMNFGATLNNRSWQQPANNKKSKRVIKMLGTKKNFSALVAILLGVLIVSLAMNVKEMPRTDEQQQVYSRTK